ELYYKLDRIIPRLKRAATIVEGKLSEVEAQKEGDYIVDEKARAVALTEQGIATCERLLSIDNLYDPQHITILHHIQQGLRAHALFKRDVDYVVKDGQVIIVDEFTGRLMPGRRWSDGLHQAVEAKEGVRIERENQTLATITFQNYFRMYAKLAGMTGTAETEAEEFAKIYKLDVTVVPTNRPLVRVNNPDVVAKEMLRKKGLDPATAATAERAGALAEARRVTEPEHARVVALGGLHIVGTERHEARRVDNQLRGRSGRQGDPGSSRFYLSLEDDLLRIFGSQRIQKIMERLGMEEGEPIEHKLVTRAIATAQKRVETHNYEIRKHLLEYDDVMNKQREIIYGMRRQILEGESQAETIAEWIEDFVAGTLDGYAAEGAHPEDWDLGGLGEALFRSFDVRIPAARFGEA